MNHRRRIPLAFALLTLAAAAGCEQQMLIGAELAFADAGQSNVLWTAGFETGNLIEWWDTGAARTLVSPAGRIGTTDVAHTGSYAAEATIYPTGDVELAELIRQGIVPEAAYYSAWYYLPDAYRVDFYVLLMSLGTRGDPLDEKSPDVPLFDVNLNTDPKNGETYFYIWDHLRQQRWESPTRVPAPVRRWFSIEMYMRKTTDDTGRVLVWIDGKQVFDVSQVSTTTNPWMRWSIGALADQGTTPSPFTVYIDDPAIARVSQTVQ